MCFYQKRRVVGSWGFNRKVSISILGDLKKVLLFFLLLLCESVSASDDNRCLRKFFTHENVVYQIVAIYEAGYFDGGVARAVGDLPVSADFYDVVFSLETVRQNQNSINNTVGQNQNYINNIGSGTVNFRINRSLEPGQAPRIVRRLLDYEVENLAGGTSLIGIARSFVSLIQHVSERDHQHVSEGGQEMGHSTTSNDFHSDSDSDSESGNTPINNKFVALLLMVIRYAEGVDALMKKRDRTRVNRSNKEEDATGFSINDFQFMARSPSSLPNSQYFTINTGSEEFDFEQATGINLLAQVFSIDMLEEVFPEPPSYSVSSGYVLPFWVPEPNKIDYQEIFNRNIKMFSELIHQLSKSRRSSSGRADLFYLSFGSPQQRRGGGVIEYLRGLERNTQDSVRGTAAERSAGTAPNVIKTDSSRSNLSCRNEIDEDDDIQTDGPPGDDIPRPSPPAARTINWGSMPMPVPDEVIIGGGASVQCSEDNLDSVQSVQCSEDNLDSEYSIAIGGFDFVVGGATSSESTGASLRFEFSNHSNRFSMRDQSEEVERSTSSDAENSTSAAADGADVHNNLCLCPSCLSKQQ